MGVSADTLTFYKKMQRGVRAGAGRALTPLLKRLRHKKSSDVAVSMLKPGGQRFLIRYGLLDSARDQTELAADYQALLSRISRLSGDAPDMAAAWVELFSEGEYGVLPEGVCSEEPRCDSCALRTSCRYPAAGGDAVHSLSPRALQGLLNLAEGEVAPLKVAELLAFVISGEKSDVDDIARAEMILKSCRGLRGVFAAKRGALGKFGMTDLALARLHALAELCRHWAGEKALPGQSFTCGRDFYDYFHLRLRDRKKEFVIAAYLDQKNRLIDEDQISEGTLTEALVHPREVFSPAIRERAAALALVHNHPSGDPAPSQADIALTKRLNAVAKLVGIRLLDHVIIGDGRYFSFIEAGLMEA